MIQVEEFISSLQGIQKEWMENVRDFLKDEFPHLSLVSFYSMPTIKLKGRHFVSFMANNKFFSMHTIDFEMIDKLSAMMKYPDHSKATTRIKYDQQGDFEAMKQIVKEIILRNQK